MRFDIVFAESGNRRHGGKGKVKRQKVKVQSWGPC